MLVWLTSESNIGSFILNKYVKNISVDKKFTQQRSGSLPFTGYMAVFFIWFLDLVILNVTKPFSIDGPVFWDM